MTRAAWSHPTTADAQVRTNSTSDLSTVPATVMPRADPAPVFNLAIESGENVCSLIIC